MRWTWCSGPAIFLSGLGTGSSPRSSGAGTHSKCLREITGIGGKHQVRKSEKSGDALSFSSLSWVRSFMFIEGVLSCPLVMGGFCILLAGFGRSWARWAVVPLGFDKDETDAWKEQKRGLEPMMDRCIRVREYENLGRSGECWHEYMPQRAR